MREWTRSLRTELVFDTRAASVCAKCNAWRYQIYICVTLILSKTHAKSLFIGFLAPRHSSCVKFEFGPWRVSLSSLGLYSTSDILFFSCIWRTIQPLEFVYALWTHWPRVCVWSRICHATMRTSSQNMYCRRLHHSPPIVQLWCGLRTPEMLVRIRL